MDGIKYQRLGDEYYYAQELFEQEELTGYLKNMLAVDQVGLRARRLRLCGVRAHLCRATGEERGREGLRQAPRLVQGPDAAGHLQPRLGRAGRERTARSGCTSSSRPRASLFADDLRDKESAKIECGKAHFEALRVDARPAQYIVARTINDLIAHC